MSKAFPPPPVLEDEWPRSPERKAEELRYLISKIVRKMTDPADLLPILRTCQYREQMRKGDA